MRTAQILKRYYLQSVIFSSPFLVLNYIYFTYFEKYFTLTAQGLMASLFVCLVIAQSTTINYKFVAPSSFIKKILSFTNPNFYLIFSYWYIFILIHTAKGVDSDKLEDFLNRFFVIGLEILLIYIWLKYFNLLRLILTGQMSSIKKYLEIKSTNKLSLLFRVILIFLIWGVFAASLTYQYPMGKNLIYSVLNWQLGIFLSLLTYQSNVCKN